MNCILLLAGRVRVISSFKPISFEYRSFNQNRVIEGIHGCVGDASGYSIECVIGCERHQMKQLKKGLEFIFVGGQTLKKGRFIFLIDLNNFRRRHLFDNSFYWRY